jgi:Phage tail tube protein.
MKDIAGQVFFKVDGSQYSVAGSVTVSLGNTSKEALVGHTGVDGFKVLPKAPFIECQFRDFPDIDLNKVERLQGVTVTVELKGGKNGVLRDASQVNALELNTEDGTYTVRFEGKSGEWLTAQD